jgi:DNA primase
LLSINDVLSRELGERARDVDYTIRCPSKAHRDTNPSCRVYPNSDEGEGLVGSVYCFGCGFSGDAVRVLKEVRGFSSWGEVYRCIREEYGVEIGKREFSGGNELIAKINVLKYDKGFVEANVDRLSRAIASNGRQLNDIIDEVLGGAI